MAKKPTYFDRMIAATLARQLLNDIAQVEDPEDGGAGTFFSTASTVLNRADFQKLVKAAKARVKALEKIADGMPPRVMDWRPFIAADQEDLDEQDRLREAGITRHDNP